MMKKKTRANIIGFAAFAIVIGLVTYLPGLRIVGETTADAATDGPQLVGLRAMPSTFVFDRKGNLIAESLRLKDHTWQGGFPR